MLDGTKITNFKLFKVGSCAQCERAARTDGKLRKIDFPMIVGYLHHETMGHILFDTGYSKHFFENTKSWPNKAYAITTPINLKPSETLDNQLKEVIGIGTGDIDIVFISHFHADHIAGLKDMINAKFYCSSDGISRMYKGSSIGRVRHGFISELVPSDALVRTNIFESFENAPLGLNNIYGKDIFGDQSCLAIPLPGHCTGHYGLAFKFKDKIRFLVGDAIWHSDQITKNVKTSKITSLIKDSSKQYDETVSMLTKLDSADIIPCHCQKVWSEHDCVKR